eukprot:SAG11_NODE_16048_length_558_cov_1.023965_1_plen_82_part_10
MLGLSFAQSSLNSDGPMLQSAPTSQELMLQCHQKRPQFLLCLRATPAAAVFVKRVEELSDVRVATERLFAQLRHGCASQKCR